MPFVLHCLHASALHLSSAEAPALCPFRSLQVSAHPSTAPAWTLVLARWVSFGVWLFLSCRKPKAPKPRPPPP